MIIWCSVSRWSAKYQQDIITSKVRLSNISRISSLQQNISLHVLLQTRFQTSFDLFRLRLIIHPHGAWLEHGLGNGISSTKKVPHGHGYPTWRMRKYAKCWQKIMFLEDTSRNFGVPNPMAFFQKSHWLLGSATGNPPSGHAHPEDRVSIDLSESVEGRPDGAWQGPKGHGWNLGTPPVAISSWWHGIIFTPGPLIFGDWTWCIDHNLWPFQRQQSQLSTRWPITVDG